MTTSEEMVTPENREAVDLELDSIARGNPGTKRMLRNSLESLATHGSSELQEAAKEILAGRIGVRHALTGNIYGRALHEGITRFREHYEQLTSDEQQELRESGRERLRQLADEERRLG